MKRSGPASVRKSTSASTREPSACSSTRAVPVVVCSRDSNVPVSSAMPAVWLERFAAYYRMWSSINGLGADLTAYRATMIEAVKHYDRLIGTDGPDDPGYSQDEQAEGYATFALYHYAHFAWLLRQFVTLYALGDERLDGLRLEYHAPTDARGVASRCVEHVERHLDARLRPAAQASWRGEQEAPKRTHAQAARIAAPALAHRHPRDRQDEDRGSPP